MNPPITNPVATPIHEAERLRRWRLVLGGEADSSCGKLAGESADIDQALAALYEEDSKDGGLSRRGGRGNSSPSVARWLGDIRKYFPSQVVQVMQRDAMERLNLRELLLQPEMLENVQPDVHLVADLISLGSVIPQNTKATARLVVRKVVDELMKKLEEPMRSAVAGALDRSQRNRRPRHAEIDWNRTIRANLRHWQPEYKTIVPETLIGYGRKARRPQREVILCIDQSGSMASSVVYASLFAAVLASLLRCSRIAVGRSTMHVVTVSTAAESSSVQSSGWCGRVSSEISSTVVTGALLLGDVSGSANCKRAA